MKLNKVASFWARVDKLEGENACWIWTGGKLSTGYGLFSYNYQSENASHFVYRLMVGPVPPGAWLIHSCKQPSCVRPDHLILSLRPNDWVERFWIKVKKGEGDACWEWIAGTTKTGYGQFLHGGTMVKAHRLSYELCVGPIPDGLWVLHRCDNRTCVNPAHLFLGNNDDNVADMMQKGRNQKGEQNGMAKLTPELVKKIRSEYAETKTTYGRLAKKYNVSTMSICRIVNRVDWKHVA